MNEKVTDIVITDDHKLFRKGMRALLEGFNFIGKIHEAGNGAELIELLQTEKPPPHLILLDINMPVMDGIEAFNIIKKHFPEQKVVILTMEDDQQFILHLIMEGVNGYLLKDSEPEELEFALKKLLKSDFYFPAELSHLVLKNAHKRISASEALPEFSQKELKILSLICKGLTSFEIADTLNLSARTVEGYRRKLFDKTGTKNIAGLVVYALKNSLVVI